MKRLAVLLAVSLVVTIAFAVTMHDKLDAIETTTLITKQIEATTYTVPAADIRLSMAAEGSTDEVAQIATMQDATEAAEMKTVLAAVGSRLDDKEMATRRDRYLTATAQEMASESTRAATMTDRTTITSTATSTLVIRLALVHGAELATFAFEQTAEVSTTDRTIVMTPALLKA